MHIFAPKRKMCTFCSKVLPGPLGPLCVRAKPGDYSRIRRCFFRILTEMEMLSKRNFISFISFRVHLARSHFPKKSMCPPLRTKPYYSKPKWRSRRPKSSQMRKSAQIHLFAQKPPFGSKSAFLVIFAFLSTFCIFGSKWPKKASRNRYSHKLLSRWAQKMIPER